MSSYVRHPRWGAWGGAARLPGEVAGAAGTEELAAQMAAVNVTPGAS